MTRTTDYPDLEIRILDRQEDGYLAETWQVAGLAAPVIVNLTVSATLSG